MGTLLNTAAILVGGLIGSLLGDRLPPRIREIVMQGIGLVTLLVGLQMALQTDHILVVLLSVMIGGVLGEWWRLEERLAARAARSSLLTRGDFARGFVVASLVFCVGPMSILGAIQDGLSGDYAVLALKSVLDGFVSLAYAASLGMGVMVAGLSVLLYQGALTLGAGFLHALLTDAMIAEMTATGGVMILGLGLVLLEIRPIRVANLLPALALAPLLTAAWTRWVPG